MRILVPERGDPTTKIGLFTLFCIWLIRIGDGRERLRLQFSVGWDQTCILLQLETGRDRVLVKHANRVERDFVEVFASECDQLF